MKISVIGTGYVGLVSGVCLADKGHQVTCVDIDQQKVESINRGIPPIYEEGLDELLNRNVGRTFKATTDLAEAVMETEVSLIAVGTPFDGIDIDLETVKSVAAEVGAVIKKKSRYHLVVVKSTVVPGTTDSVVVPILESTSGKTAGKEFGVGMNPEFLREGRAIKDFMQPDRIVLGGIDDRSSRMLGDVYAFFDGVDKLSTNNRTAEMIKYTTNSLLATLISFSNEIGNLCSSIQEVDVVDVMHGVRLDKRLSPILDNGERIEPEIGTYLEAGCGFGGSCFAKDVKTLIAFGTGLGRPMRILSTVIETNEQQPREVIGLVEKHLLTVVEARIAILGLAFKPGTDDMRESPAIPILRGLVSMGAKIKAFDPAARQEAERILAHERVVICEDLHHAIEDAEVVVLLTSWPEFKRIPDILRKMDLQPLIIDGRRMLDKHHIARYDGIGLGDGPIP